MEVSAAESETRVPVDLLRLTPEWGQLTPKQAMFMETYLAGRYDVMTAIRAAFDCSSEQNARVMSYEVLANPKIRAVLDIHFGRSSQEAFLVELQKRIEDGSLTVAQIEGAKLLCTLRGWSEPMNLPRINGYTPKREVPVGCRPILKGGVEIGYINAKGQRVDFDVK